MIKLLIAGRGRVGTGLAAGWGACSDLDVRLVGGRPPEAGDRYQADVLILAVPDDAIAPSLRAWAPMLSGRSVVLHCAGRCGVDAFEASTLDDATRSRLAFGAMHPLLSFADPRSPPRLRGRFAIAGEASARDLARRIVRAGGGEVIERAEGGVQGPAYHAAAALVANGAAALAHAGVGVLRGLGLRRGDAESAIAGLLRSVAENVEEVGVPAALSGPVLRGDVDTVRAHREALRAHPSAREAYDAVAPVILRCARANGLSAKFADVIEEILADETSE